MNYSIGASANLYQIPTVNPQPSSNPSNDPYQPYQPIPIQPIPVQPMTTQPVTVVEVASQPPMEPMVNKSSASTSPSIIPPLPNDITRSILTDPQFYVKAKPGQDCSGRFSFGVYPCDYFGECNDSVDPIEFFVPAGLRTQIALEGTINGMTYVFTKKSMKKYHLIDKMSNETIASFYVENDCNKSNVSIKMKNVQYTMSGKVFTNGNVGNILLSDGSGLTTIVVMPDEDCGRPSKYLVIPCMNPDQIIDNQTKRVLYICCCFIFALLNANNSN